ncbi:uncharacterized protein [Eurosta solidaginis]|uniref:uncharacterized protein isoform X2 n=1 Tax=Eurosta solidaginis TaxID=178769 RepID=UPI0035313768
METGRGNKRGSYGLRNTKMDPNIVYTEDKVPVYNVTFQKPPNKINAAQIKQHFSKFGKIKNVHITYGRTRATPTQCIIQYWNKEGAGAALKQRTHQFNQERVTLKACPSWEQPIEFENFLIDNNNVNLIKLNDYCLEIIFQNLDLLHQIRLSLCHPRLEQIFVRMICPRMQRHLDLQKLYGFSTWELRQFFHTFGIYLEGIIVGQKYPYYSSTSSICNFMQECNVRIRSLHIISRSPWQYVYFFNVIKLDCITELELYKCNLKDSDLENLRKLHNLQTLGVAGNHNIHGTSLKYLCKLERLSLCGCESISSDTLMDCCRYLNLIFLDARLTCRTLNTVTINYCETLETLKVSRLDENVAKLPKLRSLEVYNFNTTHMASHFYTALAQNHADDLLELKLTGQAYILFPTIASNIGRLHKLRTLWLGDNKFNVSKGVLRLIASNLPNLEEVCLNYSSRINDKHVLPLIRNCTKLQRLNLRRCRHITDELIWNILVILQNRAIAEKRGKKAQPLLILVYGTRIKKDILQSEAYKQNQHLLKLLFHVDKPLMGLTSEGSTFDIADTETNCNSYEDMYDTYSDTDSDSDDSDYYDDDEDDLFYYI